MCGGVCDRTEACDGVPVVAGAFSAMGKAEFEFQGTGS